MPVFINAKGTSINQFQLGKRGTKLYGGDSTPDQNVQVGEVWLDKANGEIAIAREGAGNPVFKNLITVSDITKSDIDALNVDAATLDDVAASNYARTDIDETFSGNVTIQGTLFFDSTTIIESNTVSLGDNIIVLNNDVDEQTAPTQDAGITINRGSAADVSLLWDETSDRWSVGTGAFAAGEFVGDFTGDLTGNVTADVVQVGSVDYTGTDGVADAVLVTDGSGSTSFSKLDLDNFTDGAWVATDESWEDDDSHFASTGAITEKIESYGYALDSEVVHKSGAETISGDKTFTDDITASNVTVEQNLVLENGLNLGDIGESANGNPVYSTGGSISFNSRTYTGTGSTSTFTVTEGVTVDSVFVFVDGLCKLPVTDYTISSATLTFASAPGNGAVVHIREMIT